MEGLYHMLISAEKIRGNNYLNTVFVVNLVS